MSVDWNRLKVFYHVMREGSVVGASRVLHVTQPAVSQSLRKLEDELGAPLFTRMHRRLVPTSAGQQLYATVEPFLEGLAGSVRSIRRSREEPSGRLRVGAPVELGQRYLPAVFASYREVYPGVSFVLELGHPSVLLPRLVKGELDLALVDVFSGKRALVAYTTVFEETLVMVGAPRLVEGCAGWKGEALLERGCFVAYARHAPALRSWFRHHYGGFAVSSELSMVVESVRAVIEGAKHGLGLAVVPSHLVEGELERGELAVLETEKPAEVHAIALARLEDKRESLAEKTFVEHCRAALSGV